LGCPDRKRKIFRFIGTQSCARNGSARALIRGRCAIVTERRRGLRWTLRRQCDANRTDENAGSVRRSRVVLAPRPWRYVSEGFSLTTGARKAASPGRACISRKAIARGKPGCLGCTCLIRVRSFATIAHGAAGAVGARLSLRPRFRKRANEIAEPGQIVPRECCRSPSAV
jgi:hypothetical protein